MSRSISLLGLLLTLATAPILAPSASADCVIQTLTRADSQSGSGFITGSLFGSSIAVSGDWAVVGEPSWNGNGLVGNGRILIYRRGAQLQWALEREVVGTVQQGALGTSVAIDAADPDFLTVVAGAEGAMGVKIETRVGGVWYAYGLYTTTPSFGRSVATNGAWTIVGAPNSFTNGSVSLFRHAPGQANWAPVGIQYWSSNPTPAEFGAALAVDGNRLLIGVPGHTNSSISAGGVSEVTLGTTTWSTTRWFSPSPLQNVTDFGRAVDLDGDRCIVGAPADQLWRGHIWTYTRSSSGWTVDPFSVFGLNSGDRLGTSVVIDADSWAYGVPGYPGGGRVQVRTSTSFSHSNSPTPSVWDSYGESLALSQGVLFVGDPTDDSQRGAVYEQRVLLSSDCDGDGTDDVCAIGSGSVSDVNGNLVPDACESPSCLLQKLVAVDGAASDRAGYSVAASSRFALVGSYARDVAGAVDQGAVTVWKRDGDALVDARTLIAPDGAAGDTFGHALAVQGDWAVVGAPGDDVLGANSGVVHVFQRASSGNWTRVARLHAADTDGGDSFGASLSWFGDQLFIGAPGKDVAGFSGRGRVYGFARSGSTFTQQVAVSPPSGGADEAFGASVSFDGSRLLVGMPTAWGTGAAQLFRVQPNFAVSAEQFWAPATSGSRFGHAVAVVGTRVIVGAPMDASSGQFAGSAWVSEHQADTSTWSSMTRLVLPGADAWDSAGTSVAVVDDLLLVGAPFADTSHALGAGVVHVLRKLSGAWRETNRLYAADGVYNQAFGSSLAYAQGELVVGAYGDDPVGVDSGSAYAFGLGGQDCNSNVSCDLCEIHAGTLPDDNRNGLADDCEIVPYCYGDGSAAACPCANTSPPESGGCLNSLGMGGRLRVTGSPRIGDDTLVLRGSQMTNSSALFFQGTAMAGGGSGVPWGDGLRCAAGTVLRLGAKSLSGGAANYPQSGDAPVSAVGLVSAPGWRYYSIWYRNPASYCTSAAFNSTNGVGVLWSI